MASISILCHVDDYNLISEACQHFEKIETDKNLYFNLASVLTDVEINSIIQALKRLYPDAKFLTNKDLGSADGFIKLIAKWIEDGSPGDFLVKYHTNNDYSIFKNFNYILELFNAHEYTGMVGLNSKLLNKTEFDASKSANKYDLKTNPTFCIKDGIFVVRSEIYKNFFSSFENFDLSLPWDTIFGNIVTEQNYIIEPYDCINGLLRVFDEYFYLSNYFDVAESVRKNHFSFGFHHFVKHGIVERRSPCFGNFDDEFYFTKYADVKAAVGQNLMRNGYDHFCGWGYLEKREFAFK